MLVAPKGHSTRPTADRTRQALFNVLEHAPWSRPLAGARVLDLFAGSGALGLEALSRGAAFCVFVDHDKAAGAAILQNLAALRRSGHGQVLTADATRAPPGPFDLVFADPPYHRGLAERALAGLAGALAEGARVVIEQSAEEQALAHRGYETLDARRWGVARVTFLRRRSPDPPEAAS
jgi:16S rRNA (guanine966-N2)-methyltransferase